MKKILLIFIAFITINNVFAQAPHGFNYQAIINGSDGLALVSTTIDLEFELLETSASGTVIYSETHNVTTNENGLVNIIIGQGITVDDFTLVNWGSNVYFMSIGVDLDTSGVFSNLGTIQLISVPYALHAKTVESTGGLSTIIQENNDANASKITNLADPTDAQDAVTKAYVDLLEARITALENGSSGGGGSITCDNVSVFTISGGLNCNQTGSDATSVYTVVNNATTRTITANQYPPTGHTFVGMGITPNEKDYTVALNPVVAGSVTPVPNTSYNGTTGLIGYVFGVMNTGVVFDPVAAEGWLNTNDGSYNYEWNLEILSTAHSLVYDCNNAHDSSRYHYHGTPTQYIPTIENGSTHSQLIGYAADGFPIYYKYAYEDANDNASSIVALKSSYCVQSGTRPGDGVSAPDGTYDGTYSADYEYIDGLGDLDACNGRFSITPEYPSGIYCYFITDDYPSIPRCFVGTPDPSFQTNIGGGPGGGGGTRVGTN